MSKDKVVHFKPRGPRGDNYIAREYSVETLREMIGDYELRQGNSMPPVQEIFVVDGENVSEPWLLDTSLIVIFSDTPDE